MATNRCVPDFKDLVYELKGVDYDALGIQLDVPYATRKSIGSDYATADRRLSEVIQYWINNGKQSWEEIIKALERIGGHQNIIDKIKSKYTTVPPSQTGIHPPHLQYPEHVQPLVAAVPSAVPLIVGSAQAQGIHPPQLQYPVHQPFVAAVPPAVHLSLGSAQAQGHGDDPYGNYLAASTESIQKVYEHWKLETIHGYGITGFGTTIALIDDGLNYQHHSMINKVNRRQLGGNGEWYKGLASHGTAVAAVAAGDGYTTQSGAKIPPGIAPNANLYIHRLGENFGQEEVSAALDHILKLATKFPIDIVAMPFSLPKSSEKIEAQLAKLAKRKIICIAAAGNCGFLKPGAEFPANCKDVLSVGALKPTGQKSDLTPPDGIDVFAFGEDVVVPSVSAANAATKLDGTSFAVPMVAGFLSLLFQCTKILPPHSKNVEDAYHNVNFLRQHFKFHKLCDQKHLVHVYKYFEELFKCQHLPEPPIVQNWSEKYYTS